jgi:3-deoxy-D-manno-octulosonate 8-phosphate phosphatase (KDO 8-P phosphatase)
MSMDLDQRAARIKLLLMDVDGVWTDGKLHYVVAPGGSIVETKAFNSQDGLGLRWASWMKLKTGVISGRNSPVTEFRARQLDVTYVVQDCIDKIPVLEEIMRKEGITLDEIAFMGDDLIDAVAMRRVGLAVATANARPEVKRIAHMVTARSGGDGAVREVIELILKAQGSWQELLRKYDLQG